MSPTVSQHAAEDVIDLAVATPAPDPSVIEAAVASAVAALHEELTGPAAL